MHNPKKRSIQIKLITICNYLQTPNDNIYFHLKLFCVSRSVREGVSDGGRTESQAQEDERTSQHRHSGVQRGADLRPGPGGARQDAAGVQRAARQPAGPQREPGPRRRGARAREAVLPADADQQDGDRPVAHPHRSGVMGGGRGSGERE